MKIESLTDELEIAAAAARVLRERFIKASRTNTVLYVKNDAVWSKAPNNAPILVKQLVRRNPDLFKKFTGRGTYKIKKRNISTADNEN